MKRIQNSKRIASREIIEIDENVNNLNQQNLAFKDTNPGVSLASSDCYRSSNKVDDDTLSDISLQINEVSKSIRQVNRRDLLLQINSNSGSGSGSGSSGKPKKRGGYSKNGKRLGRPPGTKKKVPLEAIVKEDKEMTKDISDDGGKEIQKNLGKSINDCIRIDSSDEEQDSTKPSPISEQKTSSQKAKKHTEEKKKEIETGFTEKLCPKPSFQESWVEADPNRRTVLD